MKLKKIASLALAGVMAVSMLAGCANKPGSSKPTEEPTTNMTEDVIAALNKDTTKKVTFTYSSSLEDTLKKAVQYKGPANVTDTDFVTTKDLVKFDSTLSKDWYLLGNWSDSTLNGNKNFEKVVKDSSSITYVINAEDINNGANLSAYTDAAVAKRLAGAVDKATVATTWQTKPTANSNVDKTMAQLVDYTAANFGTGSNQYYYSFDYTGTMAVVKVADGNAVHYVVAFTITRTPTKTAVPTKG